MGYATDRVMLFDRLGNGLGDLAPSEVLSRLRAEEINGEHTLTLATTRVLPVGTRVLTQDGTGKWREWVVNEPDELHETGEHAIGTYKCVWSLQYDLTGVTSDTHAEPGMGRACTGRVALQNALDGTARWGVGTVDVPPVEAGKGVVMIGDSAWERLSKVVEAWGGEVDAEIEVGPLGVTSRKAALRAHLGSTTATRRFDWARDLTSIRRKPDPGPYYCRVKPLGKGEREYAEDDETEFEWPLDISEETGGRTYIQDDESASVFRVPDGAGGWEYPTKIVTYDEDDPELLLAAAEGDLLNHTRPQVTYEASVLQLAQAGMDVKGIQLGDECQCVDRGFNADAPLRVQGRVTRLEVEELAPEAATSVTVGALGDSVADRLKELMGSVTSDLDSRLRDARRRVGTIEGGGTIVYLQNLIDQLNQEINATGGYSYAVPGVGMLTYDVAVSDPAVGAEASRVVEVSGGAVRIADSRKSDGSWDWKTVFVSGHVAASMVTAANITAGYIGSAAAGNYWNLDTGEFRLVDSAAFGTGGRTVGDVLDGIDATITEVDVEYARNKSRVNPPAEGHGAWSTTCPEWESGYYIWSRTKTVSAGGTNYSDPVMISGRDGQDGQGGAKGDKGDKGTGVSAVVEQYYLSTSDTAQTGGSWSTAQPKWAKGRHIWTRSRVTWTDGTTTYTDPVLAKAINGANEAVVVLDESLDQQEVFDRLTNNSAAEGIFLEDGHLYLNGSLIQAGRIQDLARRNFWDMSTGEFSLSATTAVGSSTLGGIASDAATALSREVGGENYLNGTAKLSGWRHAGGWSVNQSTGVASCAAKSDPATWADLLRSPKGALPYFKVRGMKVTLSFEAFSADAWGAGGDDNKLLVRLSLVDASGTLVAFRSKGMSLATVYTRKVITMTMQDSTFTYASGQSGKALAGLYLEVCFYNRSTHRVSLRRVKLERGTVATDWCPSQADVAADSQSKADSALSQARDDTEALDESLNQAEVFKRLTKNGQNQGIHLKDGRVYINGTYIESGTVNAGVMRAGILTDGRTNVASTNKSRWNLNTGFLQTFNASMKEAAVTGKLTTGENTGHKMVMENGQIIGYQGSTRVGLLDFAATIRDLDTGTDYKAFEVLSDGFYIGTPRLATAKTKSPYATGIYGFTGSVWLRSVVHHMSYGMTGCSWGDVELKFINGLFVGLGTHDVNLAQQYRG